MDPKFDAEFRKAQLERGKAEGRLASFAEVSFDSDLYGGGGGGNYVDSIAVNFDDDDDSAPGGGNSRKKFMQSFSGNKKYFEEMTADDDNDPFKETRRKTIAEREDEYRARWRKRARMSPPSVDPFAEKKAQQPSKKKGKEKPDPNAGARTYKEIMMEQMLEKEKADVLRKIAEKEKQEKEEAEQREREKVEKKAAQAKLDKKAKKAGKGKWDVKEAGSWRLDGIKNDTVVESYELEPDVVYNLGRSYEAQIKLLHESVSKHHAKISFVNGVPQIVDCNSSNGTVVNGVEIRPDVYTPLKDGDRVRFGCSTREFIVRKA